MSLQARFRERLDRSPDSRAIAFVGSRGDFAWISYAQLYEEAARRTHLLAQQGLRQGDVCMLVLPSDRACALGLLGVLLGGAVPVLVAPPVVRGLHSQLRETMKHVARKTGAKLIIMEDAAAADAGELPPGTRVLPVSALARGGDAAAAPLAFPREDDVAAMQLTSGTTGMPRVCVWKQRGVLASLDGMEQAMALESSDICVNWTPLYHDMGLVNNFFLCLAKSIPLAWLQATDFVKKPSRWLSAMHATGGTVTWSPNFGFAMAASRISDEEMEGVSLAGVKAFWNAAERIHGETLDRFRERFLPFGLSPHAVKTNFGCAENVGGATFSSPAGSPRVERIDRRALHEEGVARLADPAAPDEAVVSIVSTGAAYPGMVIRVLAGDGAPLSDGHVGEVALATPSRMVGYLDEPEETAAAIRGEWLHTGDVGYLRDGELFWTGRSRERMNLNGRKYDPSDFESVLLGVEGLREGCFAAFGVDDPRIGSQRLVIVSETRDQADRSPEEIFKEIRQRVASCLGAGVSEILLLPQGSMSKTSSGKRRHRHYKELHADGALNPAARWSEGS